jgi:hypothetical protein
LDTVLAVYTGSALNSLTMVATNDNASRSIKSSVTFNAVSNTTYRIAVSSRNGQFEGADIVLKLVQPQPPYFTLNPVNYTNVVAGSSFSLTANAIGVPSPTYQWRKDGANISGATNETYSVSSAQFSDDADYVVVASNSQGSATSTVSSVFVFNSAAAWIDELDYGTNVISFDITGVPDYTYVIQASTNLVDWSPVYTNVSPFTFSYTITTNFPHRFFRAKY